MNVSSAGHVRTQEGCLVLLRNAVALLFIIALPIALVTTTVRIAMNSPRLYEYAADHYDTPATTGIARSELLTASAELRDYFNSGSDEAIFVRVQRDGEPISLFNRQETPHLQDVKTLFQMNGRVQEASVMFILAYVVGVFIWAREGSLRTLARQVLLSVFVSLAIVGALGAVAVAGFDALWTQFHVVAFSNDFWLLDPATDRLIQMFPEAFWEDASLVIGAIILAQFGVLAAVAGAYLGLTRKSAAGYALPHGPGDAGLGAQVSRAG